MDPEVINFSEKRIEQSIIDVSSKISSAMELLNDAKRITATSEDILIQAHLELEELYVTLGKQVETDNK